MSMKIQNIFAKKNLFHNVCFFVAIMCLFWLSVRRVDQVENIVNWDELGYWGNAAFMLGYDWSDAIGRYSGYYSYGYSAICAALLFLTQNISYAYKLAVLLNGVLMIGSMLLAYYVGITYFGKEYRTEILFASFAVCIYANNITQSNAAWTECLLIFLYWLMVSLLISLQKKYSLVKCISLGGIAVYAYIVHPRVVPLLIAMVITLLVYFFYNHIEFKHSLASIFCIGIFFWVLYIVRSYIKSGVYVGRSNAELVNTVEAALPWVSSKFTLYGIGEMLKTFFLRFFYWGCTTYLFYFYFLKEAVKNVIQQIRERKIDIVMFFLLLSMLGIFGLMTLQLSQAGSYQAILYGRYQDIIVGPFFLFGILYCLIPKEPDYVPEFKFFSISMIVMVIGKLIVDAIPIYSEYFVAGCNVNLFPYFINASIGYDLITPIWVSIAVFTAIIWFKNFRKSRKLYICWLAAVCLFTYRSYETSEMVINKTTGPEYYLGMSYAYEEIKDLIKDEKDIYYVHVSGFSGSQQLGMWLQFSNYDKRLHIVDSLDDVPEGYVFVPRRKQLHETYATLVESDYPIVYENKYLIGYKKNGNEADYER